MDRPYVARELVPWGSAASADLLNAFDQPLQEGTLDPSAIAPIARLMSVGSVVYRADLQTDRYNLVRAVPLWRLLTEPVPNGLGTPSTYGDGLGPPLRIAQDDEVQLALPPGASDPPPVSIFAVRDAPSIVRSANASTPLIVSGDGAGLVDLATIGALRGDGVVLYSGTYAGRPARLKSEIAQPGSLLVVTDSNRKRARRWTSVRDTSGETERVDQSALVKDENDNRLDLFAGAGTDAQTVVQTPGVAVSTSRYGDPGFYEPEYRGARAFDGDTGTAWEVGAHTKVIGEKLRLALDRAITTNQVNLVQPIVGPNQRYLTQVDLSFDGGAPITVDLTDASRSPTGQTVTFPTRTFHRLDITIADTNVGDDSAQPFSNSVGFAEIRLRDDAPGSAYVHADEIVRMPTDLVAAAGSAAADHPLVYQMTRQRTVVIPPHFSQDEVALVRRFRVPGARVFGARGTARLATDAPDDDPRCRAGDSGSRRRGDHGHRVAASAGRHPGARVGRVRRRPHHELEHRLRCTGGPVGRRHHAATGHVRSPRPAGRRRRPALGADADPRRGRWPVAYGRRAGDHRRRSGERARDRAGAVRPAHRIRGASHRDRGPRGRHHRLLRTGPDRDAGGDRRGRAPGRAAGGDAGDAPCGLPHRPAGRRWSCGGHGAHRLDGRRRGRSTARPAALPGDRGRRRPRVRRRRPRRALDAGHEHGHRRRRAGARLGGRGRRHGAGRAGRIADHGDPCRGPAGGDPAGEGHEQGEHQGRAVGERRAAGDAVLARARGERQRRMGSDRRREGCRRLDARRRVRQRLAGPPTLGNLRRDPPVGAATEGVDRAGNLGVRVVGLPLPRVPSSTEPEPDATARATPRPRSSAPLP